MLDRVALSKNSAFEGIYGVVMLLKSSRLFNTLCFSVPYAFNSCFLGASILILLLPQITLAKACEEKDIYCTQPAETRIIEGREVYRECWQYKYKLNCNRSSKNDCGQISATDCSFVEEKCIKKEKEGDLAFCSNFKRHYACEKRIEYEEDKVELLKNGKQPDAKDLMCKMICLDGECNAVKKASDMEDQDIVQAAAMMHSLKAAKEGIVGDVIIDIFQGKSKRCKKTLVGYLNCCNLAGDWGEILGARCGSEVQNLAKARREKKCVEVGTYCSTEVLGICLVKQTSFCCYDSIIGKLLNQEAKKQLGKNNGNAQYPSCNGLSLEAIKGVDFSKTDFSEFYQAVVVPNIKIPDVATITTQNTANVKQITKNNLPKETQGFNPRILERQAQ